MPFVSHELVVKQKIKVDRSFKVVEPLIYKGKTDTIVVPAGFETDFATVPAIVAWLIERFGTFTAAAVLHDYLCVQLDDVYHGRRELSGDDVVAPVSSRDADGLFRRVLRELGVDFVTRWLMWTGVRWGALFSDYRREDWIKDAPLVLLLSVLAFPIVAPPTVLALVGRAIVKAVRFITRPRKKALT